VSAKTRTVANDNVAKDNLAAASVMVVAMRDAGRLENIDEALVQSVLSLAAVVDANQTDARLWGQYQAALRELRGTGPEVEYDEVAELVEALQGDAEVVDPEE
jgi:hypothetical protein